jgi:hypothetical protein
MLAAKWMKRVSGYYLKISVKILSSLGERWLLKVIFVGKDELRVVTGFYNIYSGIDLANAGAANDQLPQCSGSTDSKH